MNFITRLTFVGLSLILSVCLLGTPALAQLEIKTLTGLWLFDEGSGDVAADSSELLLTSVDPADKLSTTWADVKQQY